MALPTPTALAATDRYIPAGVRRVTWVPTIATQASPTVAELSAGTDVSNETAELTGFSSTSASVDVPDYGSTYVAKVPGMQSADDSTIKTYLDLTATDARTLFTEAAEGYVVIYPEGIVTGGKMNVFKVRIGSSSVDNVAPDQPATLTTMFYVTVRPSLNVAIPSV